jgi:hypothetical protein
MSGFRGLIASAGAVKPPQNAAMTCISFCDITSQGPESAFRQFSIRKYDKNLHDNP